MKCFLSTGSVIRCLGCPTSMDSAIPAFSASTTSFCTKLPLAEVSFVAFEELPSTRSLSFCWVSETLAPRTPLYFAIFRSTCSAWDTFPFATSQSGDSRTKLQENIIPHGPCNHRCLLHVFKGKHHRDEKKCWFGSCSSHC